MKNFEKVKLAIDSTIKEALQIIDSGALKIALVMDDENRLLGTLTDGDIRRGLLNGLTLDSTIEPVVNRNPIVCNINDTKETILKIALDKKIYQIPIVNLDGELIGINDVDELLKPKDLPNNVILMVGGLGTRLRPLTDDTPKPLLKVGEKPILETIINRFSSYGFNNIYLCVNYKSQAIEDYFGDGSDFGVNIKYIHEDKRMGTAGALSLIENKITEPFFVMNGDLLTNVNFENMLEYHLENQATATMGIREYDFQVPYGVVNLDNHHILSIEEKPTHKFYVSGGMYILNPDILKFIPDNTYYDMPTLFETLIESKLKTISFPIREYWLDIGQLSDFQRANDDYNGVFK